MTFCTRTSMCLCSRIPDGTTLLGFRRLVEQHQFGQVLFAKLGWVLQAQGLTEHPKSSSTLFEIVAAK